MAITNSVSGRALGHPVHILLLVSAFPLFLGALLSDWAYSVSYQVQWINFASWLIAGALVFLGAALIWAFVRAIFAAGSPRRPVWVLFGLIGVTFFVGFINALVHAKDAGATMPDGLLISVIVIVLVIISMVYGFAERRSGDQK